jgi:hypothetical protein
MSNIGFPEWMIIWLLTLAAWIAPIAIVIWTIATLRKIRDDQAQLLRRLSAIESRLGI